MTRSILSLDWHQIPVHLSIGSLLTRVVLVRQYCAGGTTISAGTLLLGIGTTGNIICDVAGNVALAFGRHAAFALGVWASITGAAAMPADPARGEKLARHWCASCHIVANDQKGGADNAPPFATIARKPGFNAGKIAQFLMDPHPKMPDMQAGARRRPSCQPPPNWLRQCHLFHFNAATFSVSGRREKACLETRDCECSPTKSAYPATLDSRAYCCS